MALPGVYVKILLDEQLEKIIREAVNSGMTYKTKEAVELIKLIYIDPPELHILTWRPFENTVKMFFHKVYVKRVPGTWKDT